jgi:uncharacterized membrane protein
MSKKTWSTILKAPAILLLIASLAAGIYAAYYNIQEMGWEVPIILAVVLVLYGIGVRMGRNAENEETKGLKKENSLDNVLSVARSYIQLVLQKIVLV